MNSAYERLSTPAASSVKLEAAMADEASKHRGVEHDDTPDDRPYYGKCQYKTGKCFNERTLKRNGEVHSLCEEHRIKQNLIQRRSDRKYQTVHAIRRRERSQRRAVLKKQVSMAVAQQLFYEHQQQKTLGVHLATSAVQSQPPAAQAPLPHPLHIHAHRANHHGMGSLANAHPAPASVASLVPPLSIPGAHHHSPFLATSTEGLASPMLSFTAPSAFSSARGHKDDRNGDRRDQDQDDDAAQDDSEDMDEDEDAVKREQGKPEDATPTGIDDFTPDAFLNLCCGDESDAFATFAPILSARAERELWTESDIDFLQTLLLA